MPHFHTSCINHRTPDDVFYNTFPTAPEEIIEPLHDTIFAASSDYLPEKPIPDVLSAKNLC